MKASKPNQFYSDSRSRNRGSALITSVIFSFVIGALAVSFLKLATYEYSSAIRASLYSSSLNLAESGVEFAIEALASGSVNSSTWTKSENDFLVDRGFTGDVKVVVLNARSASPTIYAEGVIRGHRSGDVTKQVKVELSTGFYPFQMGFSALNGISFSGNNVLLDSYHSKFGRYGETINILSDLPDGFVPYLNENRSDGIFVASDLINTIGGTAVDQGNADIYGWVTVSDGSNVNIGPRGVVTTYSNGDHDASRVLSNFYADFPVEAHPSGSYNTSHSRISGTTTISGSSNPDAPTYYDVSGISLSGNASTILTVSGHAVLVLSGDISVTGNASINIASDSSLKIYTQDDVDIGGNGIVNTDMVPSDVYIYGTAAETLDGDHAVSSQSIKIHGNGQLASVVYAPNADVTLNGGGSNGQVMGGVVAFTASVTGGSSFHFDEALREVIMGGGQYTIDSWLEMTGETVASKRQDLSAYF